MKYCKQCGSEIKDSDKFCEHCGAPVSENAENVENANGNGQKSNSIFSNLVESLVPEEVLKKFDPFGGFLGIVLLILSILSLTLKVGFLNILTSVILIAACIICLGRGYPHKKITIAALVLSVLCFICGFARAGQYGLFTKQNSDIAAVTESTEIAVTEPAAETQTTEEKTTEKKTTEAKKTEAKTTEEEVTEEEVTTEAETEKSGLDPELKAFLDSYEDYIDEYVDFMKKYKADPNNAVTMMAEYSEMMVKYADFTEKVEAYDEDEMSKEDLQYYLDVTNRCNQKLLELY